MTIESLQPYDDIYQVIDNDGTVLCQGREIDCITYIILNTKDQ